MAVVVHDETLLRTAGLNTHIDELSAAELRKVNVGSWFNEMFPAKADPAFHFQPVPTLSETLERLREFPGRIYIELKCTDANASALTGAVARELDGTDMLDRTIVKSFKLAVIPHIRQICGGVRTAALFAPKIMTMLRKERYIVNIAEEFGADELSLHYSLATANLMAKARTRGLPVTIWTADHPRWIARARKLGIHAIITNNPGRLLKKSKPSA